MGNITILKRGSDFGDIYKLFDNTSIIAGQTLISDAIPLLKRVYVGIMYRAFSLTGTASVRFLYDQGAGLEDETFTIPDGGVDIETTFGGDTNAITIQYVGAQASGTIEVNDTQIILCAPALTVVQTLELSTYQTIADVVAVIDALADWTCTKHADASGDEISTNLKILAPTACKDAPLTCVMNLPKIKDLSIPPMAYLRLRAIGKAGTPADTKIWAYVFVQ